MQDTVIYRRLKKKTRTMMRALAKTGVVGLRALQGKSVPLADWKRIVKKEGRL